jgi:ABC-type protease/lipase transport system fused ATPase/permease subunit
VRCQSITRTPTVKSKRRGALSAESRPATLRVKVVILLLNLLLLLFIVYYLVVIDVIDVKSRYFVIKFVIVKVLLLLLMMMYIMRYFISLARVQLMKFKKNGLNYTLFHNYNFEKSF